MKIGDNPTLLNIASLLELESTNKGFVFPRISISNISSSLPLPPGVLTGTVVYNTNAAIINGNGAGLYLWNGLQWRSLNQNITASAWSLTGNSGTNYLSNFIGTTDNNGFAVRTNNLQRVLVDSLGNVGIGSSSFDAINREKLLVDYGSTTSHTIANFKADVAGYLQMNLQNRNGGNTSTSDYVATADDGTDSTFYIDMGINSSTYSGLSNFGGAHDGYLYTKSRNLLIGTQSPNSDVYFLLGGGKIKTNAALKLSGPDGNIVVGKGEASNLPVGNTIRGPNGSGVNITGGNLSLAGGSATGNANGGNINITGGSTISGTRGSVNINVDSNSITNINTGISNGNIYLGNSLNNINIPKLPATSVVLTDAGKNLTASVPSNNTYLFYDGTNFTWQSSSATAWSLTGNAGTTPANNFLGTTDAQPLVFKTNNSEKMRLNTNGALLLNTTSALSTEILNANGSFKLGSIGTLHKNIISFSGNVNIAVPPQFSAVTVVGITVLTLNGGSNYADVTLTIPATLTNTLDNVFVAPTFDLPQGVAIAFARVVSTTQVKIRFVNASTSSQTVSGNFIVTVLDL